MVKFLTVFQSRPQVKIFFSSLVNIIWIWTEKLCVVLGADDSTGEEKLCEKKKSFVPSAEGEEVRETLCGSGFFLFVLLSPIETKAIEKCIKF